MTVLQANHILTFQRNMLLSSSMD